MSSLTLCSFRADKGRGRRDVASRRGFTLIELLIVIAIILILISIALPNFLEAQMRARVVKVKGEIRSLALALEQYYLDFKLYPAENEADTTVRGRTSQGLFWLSSPIKYMSRIPEDPFCSRDSADDRSTYYETGGIKHGKMPCFACLDTWAIFTRGPDLQEGDIKSENPHYVPAPDGSVDSYSPTNGTKSAGDIFQYGGDPQWIGVIAGTASGSANKYAVSPLVVDWEPYLHRLPPKLR